VGQGPEAQEIKAGKFFIGRFGDELTKSLRELGFSRSQVAMENVIACKTPPVDKRQKKGGKGPFASYMAQCEKKGKPSPIACCAPRLQHSVSQYQQIITLGDVALKAVMGPQFSIGDVQGGYYHLDNGAKVVPTIIPVRNPELMSTFKQHMGRAFRWFSGRLRWPAWNWHYAQDADDVRAFLAGPADFWAWDTETTGLEPLRCRLELLCVHRYSCRAGGQAVEHTLVIAFQAYADREFFVPVPDREETFDALRAAFWDGRVWVGANSRYYDNLAVGPSRWARETRVDAEPLVHTDIMPVHRYCWPHLPHALEYMTVTLTDAPPWKHTDTGEKASVARLGPEHDGQYSANDGATTARAGRVILTEAIANGYAERMPDSALDWSLEGLDNWARDFSCHLHRIGIAVDQRRRAVLTRRLESRAAVALFLVQEAAEALGRRGYNPNSSRQLSAILYDDLGLQPRGMTETGDWSVAMPVLRQHLLFDGLPPEVADFLYANIEYKKVTNKWLTTYLYPLRPASGLDDNGPVGSALWPDGRIRAVVNSHTPIPGRLSMSDPALQQYPVFIRWVFACALGRWMCGADAAQLHVRIAAVRWKVKELLEAFAEGFDPYCTVARTMMGKGPSGRPRWDSIPGVNPRDPRLALEKSAKKSPAAAARKVNKGVFLAGLYGAGAPTLLLQLIKEADEQGRLTSEIKGVPQVAAMQDNWLSGMPEFKRGWAREMDTAMANGKKRPDGVPWLADEVSGRPRYFFDVERDINEIYNHCTIATEAGIMKQASFIAKGLLEDEYAKNGYSREEAWCPDAGEGCVMEVHDSLSGEHSEKKIAPARAAECYAEAIRLATPPSWPKRRGAKGEELPWLDAEPTYGRSWMDA
jgi:uracil-DNA glycosylase family 4